MEMHAYRGILIDFFFHSILLRCCCQRLSLRCVPYNVLRSDNTILAIRIECGDLFDSKQKMQNAIFINGWLRRKSIVKLH